MSGATAATSATPDAAREKEASIVAKQALGFYLKKKFSLAAELYRRASEIDPSKPDYHYGVGRAEQQAGRNEQARAAFGRVLAMAAAGSPLAMKATNQLSVLDKLAAKPSSSPPPPHSTPHSTPQSAPQAATKMPSAPAATTDKPQTPASPARAPGPDAATPATAHSGVPSVVSSPPAPARAPLSSAPGPAKVGSELGAQAIGAEASASAPWGRSWMAWTVTAVGAASVVAGGALLTLAVGDQSALDLNKDDTGKYDGSKISLSDARSKQQSINDKVVAGWVSVGVGAAIAGAGSWWVASMGNDRVVLLPYGRGASVSVRF